MKVSRLSPLWAGGCRRLRHPPPLLSDDELRSAERGPRALDADNAISSLIFSVTSGGVSKEYNLSSENNWADLTTDWASGIDRLSTYSMSLSVDIQKLLKEAGAQVDSNGYYTVVDGDTAVMSISGLLRENFSFSGRLQDSTAVWNSAHNGVGDYSVSNGKLTIRFDKGYLEEKQGEILSASVQIYGGFNLDEQTTNSFTTDIAIGNISIRTKFPALEIVRNLSIEKSGEIDSSGAYVNNSSPSYPRQNGAFVDRDGYLFYKVKLTAGQDNTYKLTNLKVTDLFDETSRDKVQLSTMKLVSVISDGADKTASAVDLFDSSGNINGWSIGDLPIGATATVTYKVKIDKDVLTRVVKEAKAADASSDAFAARTIKNTVTASADSVDPVSDDYSTTVKNYVFVSKLAGAYDYETQTQNFTITVTAPSDNRYTQYDVPVSDYLSDALGASYYKESGISSMIVTHADGSSENVTWGNFSQPDSRSWSAIIPEMRPGDKVEIRSYTVLDDSYWTNRLSGNRFGDEYTSNYVYVGNVGQEGLRSADLNRVYDYASFSLYKKVLEKNNPSINSDGTVNWDVVGNGRATSSTPTDVGGKTITDTLGDNQAFDGGAATVTFYNQDGTDAGPYSMPLAAGATSFTYTIPARFGTCEYRIAYKSVITDWSTYVGVAKAYSNTVGYADGSYASTGTTTQRERVASMTKVFERQEGDWSQWRTSIYSELKDGDTYVDTSRYGVSYMYFTADDLKGITLTIDGIAVDADLYSIEPADNGSSGKYASYKVVFKGDVAVAQNGSTVKPSKSHPLVIGYRAHMVNPASGQRDYYNDAKLTVGNMTDTDYDYCRRNNTTELVKSVQSSSNGYITWRVVANYYGYSGRIDGTSTIIDTLPAGTEYVSAVKTSGSGQIDSITPSANGDGTTRLTIELSGLDHDEVSKSRPNDTNGSKEFHFTIKTRITDPDYLYGKESKSFPFTNNVELTDRYGNPKSASATARIEHVGMTKDMTYTTATAPYANFTISANADKVDLNPDGDSIGVVDKLSASLSLDTNSFSVVNASDGKPVPFTLDTSKIGSDNQVTVNVPDAMSVKITYRAQVLGFTGETVTVGNVANWEGHGDDSQTTKIEKDVKVLKAGGQAVGVPMIWFSKRDANNAVPLSGATYRLEKYSADGGWIQVRDGIVTTGDSSISGVQVGGLSLDTLYRLTESAAPSGYVLDPMPHYFVLSDSSNADVEYPAGLDRSVVFKGMAGSVVTVYDAPYVPVRFKKMSGDGVQLAGATLQVLGSDGKVARFKTDPHATEYQDAEFTTSAADATELYLAPGTYTLHESSAPSGYKTAVDKPFSVDSKGTVVVDGKRVQTVTSVDGVQTVSGAVVMVDDTKTTSLKVTKAWADFGDFDKVRPDSVKVSLFANGRMAKDDEGRDQIGIVAADGPDGVLGTDDDWTVVFDNLDVMKQGEQVSYSVREIDPVNDEPVDSGTVMGNGYTSTVSATTGDSVADAAKGLEVTIINSRTPAKTSVSVSKTWSDANNQDGVRPSEITVGLYAAGSAVVGSDGKAVTAVLDAASRWSAEFTGLDAATEDGSAIAYTVKEIGADGKELSYDQDVDGYVPRIASVAYSGYPEGVDPTNGLGERRAAFPDRRIGYVIENAHVPATMSIIVSKKWIGPFPDGASVTVRLLSDDNPEGTMRDTGKTVILSANKQTPSDSDDWKGSFTDLPVHKGGQEGQKVTYSVLEDSVSADYRTVYSYPSEGESSLQGEADASKLVGITNINVEKTSVSGAKTWDDDGNHDGKRPESITVYLLASNRSDPVFSKVLTSDDAAAGNGNVWNYVFEDLPKYDDVTGEEIIYTVNEKAVEDYSTTMSDDKWSLTNVYSPGKTSVTVTKRWDDASDQDGVRPSSVKVQLFADGRAQGDAVELNADGKWTWTWSDLYAYRLGGNEAVSYTVAELDAEGNAVGHGGSVDDNYSVSVAGDASVGYIITNSHTPAISAIPFKQGGEEKSESTLPGTGDAPARSGIVFIGAIALASAVAIRRKLAKDAGGEGK